MKIKTEKTSLLFKLSASRELSLFIVLSLICLLIQWWNSSFLTAKTIGDMLKNYSTTITLALGMMSVLLIGGIDISVSSTLAFSGMCASLMMRDAVYSSTLVMFIVSIVIGTCCGMIVGLVITKGDVIPIIATLGLSNIYRGATYIASDSAWVSAYQFQAGFKKFAQTGTLTFGLMNNLVFIALLCYVIFFVVMKWTRFGRRIYAVGSNPEAAAISGLRINRIKFTVYTMAGAFAGLVGAMYTALYASAQNDMGIGMELDVIAACVLGGVSLDGGQGTVLGVLLGALTMAVISKALPLIGISQFWQTAIKGAIILVAIIINVLAQRAMKQNALKAREI
ncbi:MAG: Ribose transport system permease protein RbsC [Firmicutes bacterium ADurb.Bin182]|nr:MAG: Ribose transport system permease protein RbsC [Firmicutes bacterium ADurb.Bin182]